MAPPPELDVLAIGHAIVDVLAHADDGFIHRHGLRKGSMELIDRERAEQLYDALGPAVEVSGGSAANTAVGVASLGGKAGFIGKVRDDQLGQIFIHDIRAAGVAFRTSPERHEGGAPTARSLIVVTPDAQRTMSTYLGVASTIPTGDVSEEDVAAAQVLYLEGYLMGIPDSMPAVYRAVDAAHRASRQVALTLSDSLWVEGQRQAFVDLIPKVDVLLGNEHEALALSGAATLDGALDALAEQCRVLAVTRGAGGSIVVEGGRAVPVPAQPVPHVIDTTGAGDLYAAGFLFGLTRGRTAVDCARLGSLAASEVISHLGPRPEVSLQSLAQEAGLLEASKASEAEASEASKSSR
jgi:sugar/nucleoside kinase (ribokinase family)